MRRSLFILALLLAGCGGDGTGPTAPVQHVPEISNLKLAPSSVEYMTGDGQAAVMYSTLLGASFKLEIAGAC